MCFLAFLEASAAAAGRSDHCGGAVSALVDANVGRTDDGRACARTVVGTNGCVWLGGCLRQTITTRGCYLIDYLDGLIQSQDGGLLKIMMLV